MCGIAGFTIADGDLGHINTSAMTYVLGYEMMSRGKDATGICTIDKRGRWKVRKKPYAADVFLASRQGIGHNAQSALIHTRMFTQGKPSNPLNNHPIVTGSIIGIHNGMVFNDDKLYDHFKWTRHAEVDSEAIFAALDNLGIDDGLLQIDGSWAIAWINTHLDPRVVWLARGSSSPLCYATTINGSVIWASTTDGVKAAFEYGGINGTPDVHYAPEGFLAHTNIEGGLTVMPAFDGSGTTAIGGRPARTTIIHAGSVQGWKGHNQHSGSYGSWDDDAWTSQDAINYQTISGDPAHPKIGDRRKYLSSAGITRTETCTSVKPRIWTQLVEPAIQVGGMAMISTGDNSPKVDPPLGTFEEDFLDDEGFGFAHTGDTIVFPKSMFGDLTGGHVAATVIDEDGPQLVIEFRRTRISRMADYRVCLQPTPKGA